MAVATMPPVKWALNSDQECCLHSNSLARIVQLSYHDAQRGVLDYR